MHPVYNVLQPANTIDLFSNGFLAYIFLTSIYYINASLIGYYLSFPILRAMTITRLHALVVSFLPGYLICVAVNRLITFFLPHKFAIPCIIFCFCMAPRIN